MIPLSQRGEIRLGFRCNARCGFCYYQELLDVDPSQEPTTAKIIRSLQCLRENGATEVEFTGGEPTIKEDLPKLAAHAKSLGFVNISLITNGLRLAKYSYAETLVNAGVNDVLFSIHGHTKELHDLHTKIPGSFDNILQAVNNLRKLGVRSRVTATVTGKNYLYLQEMMAMFLTLNFACIHFAIFSPVAQAQGTDSELYVSYADAADILKKAIDKFDDMLPPLSIKYIPFCFLVGYEQYVMNLYQQSYDPDDWNYYYSNKVRRASTPLRAFAFDALSLFGALLAKVWKIPLQHGWLGLKVVGFTRLVELLRKKHPFECKKCKYSLVCDGVWRSYAKIKGSDAIKAVRGDKIKHPAWSYVMARYRTPGEALPVTPEMKKTENLPVRIPIYPAS